MSDNEHDDNQTPSDENESSNARRMRERIEALEEERKTLLGRVRLSAFKEAGIDPEQGGLNKAIYRTYDGDPDPEAIREFAAQEYEWKPPSSGVPDAQRRAEAALGAGEPPDPKSALEAAEEAAASGDWLKSGALKDAELLALTNKRFGY